MILFLKDKGLILKIPGFKDIHTPAKIVVNSKDIDLVMSYLRKEGISNYSVYDEKGISMFDKKEEFKPNKEVIIEKMDDSRLLEKLSSIENILTKLLLKDVNISNNYYSGGDIRNKNLKSDTDEDFDDIENAFIPEINVEGLTTKTSLTISSKEDRSDDIEDLAKLLSQISE